jgi:hypothetical protein
MRIIQIQVGGGDDYEIYGLGDDGVLYTYTFGRMPYDDRSGNPQDGHTAGWCSTTSGRSVTIPNPKKEQS